MTIWTTLAISAFLVQPTPKFDVASVRPSSTCQSGGRSPGRDAASPDRLDVGCRTVMELIQTAYGRDVAVSGGPAWITSEHYDIDAKAETPQSQATMRGPMLQALLAERFQLKIHRESKEVPVYALTVGKGAPKLQVAQAGKCTPRGEPRQPGLFPCGVFAPSPAKDGAYAYGTTLADFCVSVSGLLDRRCRGQTWNRRQIRHLYRSTVGTADGRSAGRTLTHRTVRLRSPGRNSKGRPQAGIRERRERVPGSRSGGAALR